jgi:hypothetical protein
MTIVIFGAMSSLNAAGGLSASALAGATVGSGLGLAGRLVNAGGPASTIGGAVGGGISAGSIMGASVNLYRGGAFLNIFSRQLSGKMLREILRKQQNMKIKNTHTKNMNKRK